MSQSQLDRAVARSTGESLRTVHRLGFSTLNDRDDLEPEDLTLAVDCPFCGRPAPPADGAAGPPDLAECDRCDVWFEYHAAEVYAAGAADLILAAAEAA